jgi:hypothetical protein
MACRSEHSPITRVLWVSGSFGDDATTHLHADGTSCVVYDDPALDAMGPPTVAAPALDDGMTL